MTEYFRNPRPEPEFFRTGSEDFRIFPGNGKEPPAYTLRGMGILDDIVDLLCPATEEQRKVEHALSYLAPKFGLRAGMPEVVQGHSSHCKVHRRWGLVNGRRKVVARRHVVMLETDADRETAGEETGHYLHALANVPLEDAVHFDFKPSTQEAALGFVALRNWEECIGRYAGLVYARHCGERLEPVRTRYHGNACALRGERPWRTDEEAWGDITHLPGYCAADDLYAADSAGAGLGRLARIPLTEAVAEGRKLDGWTGLWPHIERRAADAERLARKYTV